MNRLPNTLIQFFEEVYLESQLNQVLDEEEKQKTDTQTNNNWSEEMKKLRGLLTAPVELEQIPFTEENLNKLGTFIQTPIEKVYLSNIGQETLFHKMNRKAGGRSDIDRRQFIDAIPKVLSNPAFIIEHKPNKDDDYQDIRHLYFKTVTLNNNNYKLMFVVSLTNIEQPKLLSFYNVDDIFKKINESDVIVYKDGRKTEIKLQKTTLNP